MVTYGFWFGMEVRSCFRVIVITPYVAPEDCSSFLREAAAGMHTSKMTYSRVRVRKVLATKTVQCQLYSHFDSKNTWHDGYARCGDTKPVVSILGLGTHIDASDRK